MSSDDAGLRLLLGEQAMRHPDRQDPFDLGAPASVPDVATLADLLEYWAERRSEHACAYFIDLDENTPGLGLTVDEEALKKFDVVG